ncbi:hypothetical protein EDD86DRAFT_245670 [Gorgonomyces haynaldii]|nr:hypothetical protein EDD86DRAFT_245395 [Gorgonomyces haynaldii]KAI8912812.1 hypothetical protein EDD86DRAFT_245670 [Gorgonomyces haynaldii]
MRQPNAYYFPSAFLCGYSLYQAFWSMELMAKQKQKNRSFIFYLTLFCALCVMTASLCYATWLDQAISPYEISKTTLDSVLLGFYLLESWTSFVYALITWLEVSLCIASAVLCGLQYSTPNDQKQLPSLNNLPVQAAFWILDTIYMYLQLILYLTLKSKPEMQWKPLIDYILDQNLMSYLVLAITNLYSAFESLLPCCS